MQNLMLEKKNANHVPVSIELNAMLNPEWKKYMLV